MEPDELEGEFASGVINLAISLVLTYGASIVYPTADLQWALIAVGFASFFSGFFGSYYAEE